MFNDPVIEQYRVGRQGDTYSGVFTLAYPSPDRCIVLAFISVLPLKKSHLLLLKKHVITKGRKYLVFYRQKRGNEIEKVYTLYNLKYDS